MSWWAPTPPGCPRPTPPSSARSATCAGTTASAATTGWPGALRQNPTRDRVPDRRRDRAAAAWPAAARPLRPAAHRLRPGRPRRRPERPGRHHLLRGRRPRRPAAGLHPDRRRLRRAHPRPIHCLGRFKSLFTITSTHLYEAGAVVVAYGVLEATEMVGLWLARRWAEYLTFVATVDPDPLRGLRAHLVGEHPEARHLRHQRGHRRLPAVVEAPLRPERGPTGRSANACGRP